MTINWMSKITRKNEYSKKKVARTNEYKGNFSPKWDTMLYYIRKMD